MQMPGRNGNTGDYRYGYQGSEKDDEIRGEGNSYTTFYRQLDVRLGRWLSYDPKAGPSESPYASMGNNPVLYNDQQGDTLKLSSSLWASIRQDPSFDAALLSWIRSDLGQQTINDYGIGGKYEHITVVFGTDMADEISNGGTLAYAVNKETGVRTPLATEGDKRWYAGYEAYAKAAAKWQSTLGADEYLLLEVNIATDFDNRRVDGEKSGPPLYETFTAESADLWNRKLVTRYEMTIVHEWQHVTLITLDIMFDGVIDQNAYDQHIIMKDANGKYYKQRKAVATKNIPEDPDYVPNDFDN
jgi:RHS repeat-associated protein